MTGSFRSDWGEYIVETWKDIPGFEGLYKASSLGRIRKSMNGGMPDADKFTGKRCEI